MATTWHDLEAGTDILKNVLLVLLSLEDLSVNDDHRIQVGAVVLPFNRVLLKDLVGVVSGTLFAATSIRALDTSIK